MQMETAYGIFDNEADHIIAMVHEHAPLDDVVATYCPACGAKMIVAFNSDGTGFSLSCRGEPLHITAQQEIEIPPPWWQQCYEEPTDMTWYWRERSACISCDWRTTSRKNFPLTVVIR